MKKYKEVYKVGEFTYYTGEKCKYVIAAVSRLLPEFAILDYNFTDEEAEAFPVEKELLIGIAVCRPCDMPNFDLQLGIKKAVGKALGSKAIVVATNRPGVIGTKMVEAVLSQEMAYFESNPGAYLAGYTEAKDKYDQENALKLKTENLSMFEVEVISGLRHLLKVYDKELIQTFLERSDLVPNVPIKA